MLCPYVKNKQVVKEFNEIVEAFGGLPMTIAEFENGDLRSQREGLDYAAMEAAYKIWHKTNGNGMELAPNGAASKLFYDLLQSYNGDRVKAIQAKAKTLSKEFFDWFGDWTSDDKTNVSKVVDENGEPLIVWHGGNKDILEFKPSGDTTGNGYYVDPLTNEHVPYDSNRAMFFSTNKYVASSYRTLTALNKFNYLIYRVNSLISTNYKGKGAISKDVFKTIDEVYSTIEELSEFNPRFSKFLSYLKQIRQQGLKLKSNEVDEFRKMLIDVRDKIRPFANSWLMNRSEWEEIHNKSLLFENEYNNENGIKSLLNGKIPDIFKLEFLIFKKIEEQRSKLNLPEISNYKEVHLNVGDHHYLTYDGINLKYDEKNIVEMSFDELRNEFDLMKTNILYDQKKLNDEIYEKLKKYGQIYPVFLNIKNPLSHDYEGTHLGQGYKLSNKYPFGYVAARQVNKAIKNGNDGVVYENLYDPYLANNYGVFDSNQIKSIDNEGNFSTTDNNIYHNLPTNKINTVDDLKTTLSTILKNYYDFHKYNDLRTTKDKKLKQEYEDQLSQLVNTFGFPTGTMYIDKYGKIKFNDNLLNNHFNQFKDDVENHKKINDIGEIVNIFRSIQSKFNGIVKIEFRTGTDYNAKFENGVVYINPNRVSADTLFEECLHPFVEALYNENRELFDQLLNLARKDFPKLRSQIAVSYKSDKFTKEDRYKELVTQALSRHYAEIYEENNKEKSIWKKAFEWIIEKLNLNKLSDLTPNITLRQLAEAVYNSDNINIDLKYYNNTSFNLNSKQGSVSDILGNTEYDDIKNDLEQNGINDDNYAMRTAIHKSRNDYMDSEQAKFTEDYIEKLKQKPNTFYEKVKAFFKSPFNKNIIKDPLTKDVENVRSRSKLEFDNTLYHNNIMSIIDVLEKSNNVKLLKVGQLIRKYYEQNDKTSINNLLSFIDLVSTNSNIIYNNLKDVYNTLSILEDLESDIYKKGILLFGNKESIGRVLMSNDNSKLNKDLKDYISNFKLDTQKWMEDNLNEGNSTYELRTMFFQFDDSLKCPNEEAYDRIKSGLESRLISIQRGTMASSKNILYNIKSRISKLKLMNMYDVADMYQVYSDFLDHADVELSRAVQYFEKCIANNEIKDAEYLMYFKKDVLGYYLYIIDNYIKKLSEESGLSQSQIKEIKDLFKNSVERNLSKATDLYYQANEIYVYNTVDKFVSQNMELGNDKTYARFVKQYLDNKINNGAVEMTGQLFGDPNSSKSPVVRIIANMLNKAERSVHRSTYERGKDLMTAYKNSESILSKIGHPSNYMKNFVELDDEGRPTGNFIRDVNYGQFKKDMKNEEARLRKKYGLSVDDRGNTIFHWELKNTEDVYNKYQDELDDWLDNHCNRRYSGEYYKQRRRFINYKVRQVLNPINEQINLLQDKCTVNGFVYVNKLSLNERTLLENLIKQKQEVSNPYLITYDTNNGSILSLELKEGDELEIAQRIQSWNKLRAKHIKRTNSDKKFQEALKNITDPREKLIFKDTYKKLMIDPEFYELLQQCSTASQTEEYLKISSRRSRLLNSTKEDGQHTPNLLRLNDQAWDELNNLEQEMELRKISGKKGKIKFDDIATKSLITITDPQNPNSTITVLNYYKRLYQQKMLTDPNAMNDFYNRFYIRTKDKNNRDIRRPLNVFYETLPKNQKYIIELTTGPYIEYEKSDWINSKYDDSNSELYQPVGYENKKFKQLMSDNKVKAFYDKLISMMDEAVKLLPPDVNASKYKMPQITDSGMSLLVRNTMSLHFKDIPKSMSQYFTITENDEDFYRENRARRPDNSVVETIPMRFIKDLEDPSTISCDIVGTVILFYQMAQNYSKKSETVPIVESMIELMKKHNSTSSQVKQATTELEMYGYGKMQKGLGDETRKMTGWEKFWTKMINNHRHLALLALLSGNIASATKGAISAQWQVMWSGIIGKYYSMDDLLFSYKKVFTGLPNAIRDLGSSGTHNLLLALMLKDGAARSTEDIFSNKHKSRFRRLLSFFKMGFFTIGDYTSNALITACVYHATRLVEDPQYRGTYKFMTKTQCIDAYKKLGLSVKQAKKAFKRSRNNNLFRMYELNENGAAVLKKSVNVTINGKTFSINPEYYVRPDGKTNIEDRVAGTIESRASIANGVVAEHGKGAIYQNTFAKLVMVMRGFLIAQGYDRLKTGNDFEETYYNEGKTKVVNNNGDYKGQYNFETGEVERGTLLSTWEFTLSFIHIADRLHDLAIALPVLKNMIADKTRRNTLTREDIMGVKQTLGDIIGAASFLAMCAFIFIPATRRYPESWFLALMRQVTAGVGIETMTMLNPNTGLDLLTSVTTVKSWIDDYLSVVEMIKVSITDPSKLTETISSSSAYKDKPRWFRYLMKIALKPTGITGYYESLSPAIPGIDKDNSKYLQIQQLSFSRIDQRPWFDSASNFGNNLYDLYNAFSTPYGMDTKYDYYQKNVTPATWLPKRKDENEENNKKFSRSRSQSSSKSSSKRGARK